MGSVLNSEKKHFDTYDIIKNKMLTLGVKRQCRKGNTLVDCSKNRDLYLIVEGDVSLHRSSDKLLMGYIHSPSLLCVVNLFNPIDIVITAKEAVTYYVLPQQEAMNAIDSCNGWQMISELLAERMTHYAMRDSNVIGKNAYDIIKYYLNLLLSLPVEERYNLNAAKYITERTRLSRSRVMYILQQLIKGGYIVVNNGVLVKIIFLPEKF